MQIERDADRPAGGKDGAQPLDDLALGIGIVIDEHGAVQRQQQPIQPPGVAQALFHFAHQRIERGAHDRTAGPGMRGEQWNRLDAGFAEHVEESANLDAGGAVAGEHLRPTMHVDRAEGIEIRAEGDEGVGFLHEGADGDAHGFRSPPAAGWLVRTLRLAGWESTRAHGSSGVDVAGLREVDRTHCYPVSLTFQKAGGCAGVKFSRCVLMPYSS